MEVQKIFQVKTNLLKWVSLIMNWHNSCVPPHVETTSQLSSMVTRWQLGNSAWIGSSRYVIDESSLCMKSSKH
jgi:hypothetical protein